MLPFRQSSCNACPEDLVVQWQRRPTDVEVAGLVAAEQERRALVLALADPAMPPPVFGPLPDAEATTIAVFACADHAISLDAAACIHSADCPAPHPDRLLDCGCDPEPHPGPQPLIAPMTRLPSHWATQ